MPRDVSAEDTCKIALSDRQTPCTMEVLALQPQAHQETSHRDHRLECSTAVRSTGKGGRQWSAHLLVP